MLIKQGDFMTSTTHLIRITRQILFTAIFAITLCASSNPEHARAADKNDGIPNLNTFIKKVRNGDMSTLRGIYAPNIMAYPIMQQPEGDSSFVSTQPLVVTEFNMAARMNNIGLLAHNYLAGRSFFNIKEQDQITLIYGNGSAEGFIVQTILKYKALPNGIYMNIETKDYLDTKELFYAVYSGDRHLTLQTCIQNEKDPNWGRLFIIATPIVTAEKIPVSAGFKERKTTLSIGWTLRTRKSSQATGSLH
jgi:hypothetical protein